MNLQAALDFVAPKIRDAAMSTSTRLTELGIRHALAGGLAVGAHGYLRATNDVIFLVGDEAFEKHGSLVTFKAGVPIEVAGVKIDYLSPAGLGPHVERILAPTDAHVVLPVVPSEVLIFMKFIAWRRRDQLDVVELLRSGVDGRSARAYLERHAPDLLPRFDELANEAAAEECPPQEKIDPLGPSQRRRIRAGPIDSRLRQFGLVKNPAPKPIAEERPTSRVTFDFFGARFRRHS